MTDVNAPSTPKTGRERPVNDPSPLTSTTRHHRQRPRVIPPYPPKNLARPSGAALALRDRRATTAKPNQANGRISATLARKQQPDQLVIGMNVFATRSHDAVQPWTRLVTLDHGVASGRTQVLSAERGIAAFRVCAVSAIPITCCQQTARVVRALVAQRPEKTGPSGGVGAETERSENPTSLEDPAPGFPGPDPVRCGVLVDHA